MNNIVSITLDDYNNLIKEKYENESKIKILEERLDNININFDHYAKYIRENMESDNKYHIDHIKNDSDFSLADSLNKKLKNYHYENIFNQYVKVGVTFDEIEKNIDTIIEVIKWLLMIPNLNIGYYKVLDVLLDLIEKKDENILSYIKSYEKILELIIRVKESY